MAMLRWHEDLSAKKRFIRHKSGDEMHNHRKSDRTGKQSDAGGEVRLYFQVPVFVASVAEPTKSSTAGFERRNLHFAK